MTGAPFEPPTADLEAREQAALGGLERVQARVASGMSRDAALVAEPADLRPDIEEMLGVPGRVASLAEPPSEVFAAALESRLLDAADAARVAAARRRPRWWSLPLLRLAATVAAVVLALGVGGFAAVDAAEETIPGDALYPVKEASENVRLFFARGDGVTRLRLAQLAHRQAELEQAVARDAAPRVVLRLEAKVAIATTELVKGARRFDAAGNGAPAEASLDAVTELHDRIERLAGEESRPEVERLLRRMALYLEGQERALGEIARDGSPGAAPSREVPSATPATGARPSPPPAPLAPAVPSAPLAPQPTATRPASSGVPALSSGVPSSTRAEADGAATVIATATATASVTAVPSMSGARGIATATPSPAPSSAPSSTRPR
ncbi:MAG: hypothetical protein IT299_09420 [Dehalococcoidia bacterium]|nr:hypothetical protein [Dehalococcoidia bacterium]